MKCFKCRKTIKTKQVYGLHPACYIRWFCLKDFHKFKNLDPKKQASAGDNFLSIKKTTDSFYHGRYLKYSADLSSIKYILKIQQEKHPALPEMEYICNKIALILKLDVPDFYLIQIKDEVKGIKPFNKNKGLKVFMTKNFMQNQTGTLNHIYKYLPKNQTKYTCENIIKVIKTQTKNLKNIDRFVEICLFDSLVGNNDRHGRNLGIIDQGNTKHLAPMYDNPSYFGTAKDDLLEYSFNISGCIRTSVSTKPKTSDYMKEFKKLGFEETVSQFIHKASSSFPNIIDEVKISGISKKRKSAFVNYITERLKELKNE